MIGGFGHLTSSNKDYETRGEVGGGIPIEALSAPRDLRMTYAMLVR